MHRQHLFGNRMDSWKMLVGLLASGITPFIAHCGLSAADPSTNVVQESAIDLLGPHTDWRPQDFEDSRGVPNVHFDPQENCLLVDCDLLGGDTERSKGEVLLDLKYVSGIAPHVPIDMSTKRIIAEVEVPPSFVTPHGSRNGLQLLVQDDELLGQYGTWVNVGRPGRHVVHLQPSKVTPWLGFTQPGMSPTRVRTIGIKIAINEESTFEFRGQIKITNLRIVPTPLPFTPPPEFAEGIPQPHVTGDAAVRVRPDGFYVDGKKTFIVGGNFRGIAYGQNFGSTNWFPGGIGMSAYPRLIEARLRTFRNAGLHWLRVNLLADGRAVLDRNGAVVGYTDRFRNDVQTFLDLAAAQDIKVQFCVLDFLIAGQGEELNGVWLRGRRQVIEDPAVRRRFVTDFVQRFITEFGEHRALVAIDGCNEPEWFLSKSEGGGWEDVEEGAKKAVRPISRRDFEDFVSECAAVVRRLAPNKLLTVGVSCKHVDLVRSLPVDYYAMHWYPWMGDLTANLKELPTTKPYILEEFPGTGDVSHCLEQTLNSGGAGALIWNLSPGIDEHTPGWLQEAAKLREIHAFSESLSPDN